MKTLFELMNNNTAMFYLIVYLVLLLVAGVSFLIYRTCIKKKVDEDRSVFVSSTEHNRMTNDIMLAESFGNEPLSKHDFHTVIQNGSISRKQKNVCLVCSLSNEEGYTL